MASSSRRSASASWATAMNALLRWETSMTDMPLDFQSVISAWAWVSTSSGSVAGPAAKLNTRIVLSSGNRPSCRTRIAPGRYCPGARTISGRGRAGRATLVIIQGRIRGTEIRGIRARTRAVHDQALDALDTGQPLALVQPDEAYALRIAAHDGDLRHRGAHQRAGRTDEHELMLGIHLQRRDHLAVALGSLQRDDALAAAAMRREVLERRELAVAIGRGREDESLANNDQRDEFLALAQLDAAHAGGLATHGPHFVLVEADGLATVRRQDDLARAIGERHADQAIALVETDRNDAAGARPGERRQRRLLHGALAGGHEHEMIVVVLLDGQHGIDLLALFQRQQVHHRLATRAAARER